MNDKLMMVLFGGLVVVLIMSSSLAYAGVFDNGIPEGWTCTGNCGTSGADGVVTLPPSSAQYGWISTYGGALNGMALPEVGGGNGTRLRTAVFSAHAGDSIQLYLNYVSTDGAAHMDYAWARLLDVSSNQVAMLYTARNTSSGVGNTVPGFGMPPVDADLTPAESTVNGGGPVWSPLGINSGGCWYGYTSICGYTDWIRSDFVLPSDGEYVLEFGVVNWGDYRFQSGLAFDLAILDAKQSADYQNVNVVARLPRHGVELKQEEFRLAPGRIEESEHYIELEWTFDTFSIGQLETLDYPITILDPKPGEVRTVLESIAVTYKDRAGLPHQQVFGPQTIEVLPSVFSVSTKTDRSVYSTNEEVAIDVVVTNLGQFPITADAHVAVTDSDGAVVQDLGILRGLSFVANETKRLSIPAFPTGNTFAGHYQVKARLFDQVGVKVAESSAGLEIAPTSIAGQPTLAASIKSDRRTYAAWDTAVITIATSNRANNATSSSGIVDINVQNPLGESLLSRQIPFAGIPAGGRTNFTESVGLIDAAEGSYTLSVVVREADSGLAIVSAASVFEVERSDAQSLLGSVEVQQPFVYIGETNMCTSTVSNRGATQVSAAQLRYRLVDIATGSVLVDNERTLDLAGGDSDVVARSVASSELAPGGYACLLSAVVGGETKNIAQATFQVKRPPIRINTGLEIGLKGRLLVLMDDVERDRHDDENGGVGACPEQGELGFATNCRGRASIDLEEIYGRRVGEHAEIDIEFVDPQGALIHKERTGIGSEEREWIAYGAERGLAAFALERVTEESLSVRVVSGEHGQDCQFEELTVHVSVWEDEGLLPVIDGAHTGDTVFSTQLPFVASDENDCAGGPSPARLDTAKPSELERLEALLRGRGWNFTIVTDADAFERELHSGGYLAYVLMSDRIKLPERVQKELREAVFRGEGLLVAGVNDWRNGRLHQALGVRLDGKAVKATGVMFESSPLGVAGEMELAGSRPSLGVRLDGAVSAAHYTVATDNGIRHGDDQGRHVEHRSASDRPHHDKTPEKEGRGNADFITAVTHNTYGLGHSAFAGFDLLKQVGDDDERLEDLLIALLDYVHPEEMPTVVGGVLPVRVLVANEGIAVSTELSLSLSSGTTVMDPDNGVIGVDGRLIWTNYLPEKESVALEPWLRLPKDPGAVSFDAVVTAATDSGYAENSTLSLPLNVRGGSLSQAQAALDALAHDRTFHKAAKQLRKADGYLSENDPGAAMKMLLAAADVLSRVGNEEADAVRYLIANAVREVGMLFSTESVSRKIERHHGAGH